MPIKPENRARYPADWKKVSHAAKERAAWGCVHPGCSARQYDYGFWSHDAGAWSWVQIGTGINYTDAKQCAAEEHFSRHGDGPVPKGYSPIVVIVLTVAHLNHEPEDCRPENLAPMCQRHHLAYDAKHHAQTAYATRRARANTMELPL